MTTMGWSKLAAVGLVILGVVYLGYRQFFMDDFKPDLKADLPGKIIAVPSSDKPGELVAWQFDKSDVIDITQLDVHTEGRKRIVYVEVSTNTKDKAHMQGIMEAHYVKIKDKHYLVALGSLTLVLDLPTQPPATKEPKDPKAKKEESKSEEAQPFPTDKR